MLLLAPLVLAGPLLLLAEAVVVLSRYGPLGWLAALALVVAVVAASRWAVRTTLRWWATTAAPPAPVSGGTGPAAAERPARPAGSSPA